MGKGYPDLNLIYRGNISYVEIKDGAKPPSARKLTPDQVEFHAKCLAHGYTVHVIKSVDEAIQLIRGMSWVQNAM